MVVDAFEIGVELELPAERLAAKLLNLIDLFAPKLQPGHAVTIPTDRI